ncbi:MAG: phosphate regulon response regulator PhoB, partial [Caulobacteraceae bacterium]|nr:phosphate regulon response regulator PhoB [Caulobacteraceae bacterium]
MAGYLLVVEDDESLATLLTYNLQKEGYEVDVAPDGEEALVKISERAPDLVILDWMIPGVSGIEVCRRMKSRPASRDIPVVFVTARGEEADRVRGLDTGADDYITKPFSMTEVMARLRAVLRRSKPGLTDEITELGDVLLDRVAHRVKRSGSDVHLGPTEFKLLDHLMRHPRRVFSREQLMSAIWGQDSEVEARTVDVHIGRLRKALNGETHDDDPIRTVRSAGYSLDV